MQVTLVYYGRYHVREALDLETLASVLRAKGHEVGLVYDPGLFGVTDNVFQFPRLARRFSNPDRMLRRIAASRPGVVVFSVLPATYSWCRDMAERVKQAMPDPPIVFLGLHPTLAPARVMRDAFVDFAVQGEAENVMAPLLDVIAGRGAPSDVGNLWYRENGMVRATDRAELVDLDALPLPDKDLFRPHVSHAYSYVAMVSRGCPYQCSFCEETCSKDLYGRGYFRRKSVDTVMRELVEGKKRYGFREVIFKDSYLSGDKVWLRELMRRYREEIGVPFKCFCTILGFDEETAELLKSSGCYNIEFGLQTWNARIRREILNRRETNDDAFRAFGHCASQKLWYDVDHMFNLPGETTEDHREGAFAYRKLRRLNRIKVHFLVYLPTAEIVSEGRKAGDLPDNVEALLADGRESDFYNQETGNAQRRADTAAYATLYKLLPALPNALFQWLMKKGRFRFLRRIPSPLMAFLQALMAFRSGDLRFRAYLHVYPRKIWMAFKELAK